MSVDDVYTLMKFILAKNIQQGYFSPDDFNRTINMAQRNYLDYLKGEYQKYQQARPIAVVEFSQNQMIRQSLAPLIYNTILNPNTTTGIAGFPNDLEYTDAMWLYSFKRVKFIQQDSLDSYYNSQIDPITVNPVYLINHEGFQFYPTNVGMTRLSYLRTPPSIVWAYIEDSNGIPRYDAANSQQPVWAETDMMQVIVRALAMCGINLQLGSVVQYSQEIKNNGQ